MRRDLRLYGRLLAHLRPYRRLVAAAVLATAAFAVLDAFSMLMLIPFLNAIFGDAPLDVGEGNAGLEWVLNHTIGVVVRSDGPPQELLLGVVLFILGVFLVKNVFDFMKTYLMMRLEQGVTNDLRNRV